MTIKYDHKAHRYYDDDGEYTSVTQLIAKYTPVFDTEGVSAGYAKMHGQTAEYWQAEWAKKALASRLEGTKIHKELECDVTLGLFVDKKSIDFSPYGIALRNALEVHLPNFIVNTYYTEDVVFSKEYKVAGTYDLLLIGKLNGEPYNMLVDYKTGKNVTNIFGFGNEMMKSPFNFLPNSKYSRSAMQLGLYGEMCEAKRGIKIDEYIIAGIAGIKEQDEVYAEITKVTFLASCSKLSDYFYDTKTERN